MQGTCFGCTPDSRGHILWLHSHTLDLMGQIPEGKNCALREERVRILRWAG